MGMYEDKVRANAVKMVEMGQILGDLALEGKIHECVLIVQGPELFSVDSATIHGNSALGMVVRTGGILQAMGLGGGTSPGSPLSPVASRR